MDSNINPKHLEYLNTLVAKYGSRVFSMRNKKPDADNIYIGRGKGSILSNPFFTKDNKTLEDRINNCISYRRWIANVINTNSNPELIQQIKNLKGKNVICWCSNGTECVASGAKYCHGHIILAVCDHLNSQN